MEWENEKNIVIGLLDGLPICWINLKSDVYKIYVSYHDIEKEITKDFNTLDEAKSYIEKEFLKNMEKRMVKLLEDR